MIIKSKKIRNLFRFKKRRDKTLFNFKISSADMERINKLYNRIIVDKVIEELKDENK